MRQLYFKHEIYPLANPKFKALVIKYGAAGYAVFFSFLEMLYRADGRAVSEFEAKQMAVDLRLEADEVIEILDYASSSDCDYLIRKNRDSYSCRAVAREIRRQKEIRKQKSLAGIAGMQSRWRNKDIGGLEDEAQKG